MNKSLFASPTTTGLLANRYQLKQIIGRGGMGEVFLASDVLLGGVPVAIKFISQTVSNSQMQQDFAREALMSAALGQKSIHIVRVTDYGVSQEGKPFYVMEYLCGKSLKDLIPMSLPMFIALSRQICLGLQCAHQGVNINGKISPLVHRDIKPANVFVVPDSTLGQLVKILDFGIAKFLNYSTTIATNKGFHGTLAYSSPEQLEGGELDSRSDIYSLGVMMFEMLTGKKPWQPETDLFGAWYKAHHFEAPRAIATVNPNLIVPKKLDDLIMACLAKTPNSRPQNLAEVLQVLENFKIEDFLLTNKHKQVNSPLLSVPSLSVRQVSQQFIWPKDKPIQEIVFPQLVSTKQGDVAALSLMLSSQEIKNHTFSKRYNEFIFITSPHPMLLWVTLLYSQKNGPKWLPCYLDMQNPENHKLVSSLALHGSYPLIFFTLEAPHSCTNLISSYIQPNQRQMLKILAQQNKALPPSNVPQLSKNLLKQKYKQMQSRMLQHLASTPPTGTVR